MDANEFNKLSDCFFFRVTDLNLAGQNFVAASVRNGEWEWLVEFDGNVVLDLHTLGPFLDKYSSKPLLLLDWSYHEDCGDDGFQCFSHELHNMLHARRKYIEDSKDGCSAREQRSNKQLVLSNFCQIILVFGFVYGPTSGSANLPKNMMAVTGQGQESGVEMW